MEKSVKLKESDIEKMTSDEIENYILSHTEEPLIYYKEARYYLGITLIEEWDVNNQVWKIWIKDTRPGQRTNELGTELIGSNLKKKEALKQAIRHMVNTDWQAKLEYFRNSGNRRDTSILLD